MTQPNPEGEKQQGQGGKQLRRLQTVKVRRDDPVTGGQHDVEGVLVDVDGETAVIRPLAAGHVYVPAADVAPLDVEAPPRPEKAEG